MPGHIGTVRDRHSIDSLDPAAYFNLVPAARDECVIVKGKQVPRSCQIAARVGAGQAELRSAVERRASSHNHGADGRARHPAIHGHWRCARKVERRSRKSKTRRVQHSWRKHMLLLDCKNLLAKIDEY